MMRPTAMQVAVFLVASGCLAWALRHSGRAARAAPPAAAAPAGGSAQVQVEKLQAEIKRLEGLLPDQAAVMSHVGYHFSNLWWAIDRENWPLADFYLGETKNNIDWAVRTRPVRKNNAGQDVDLRAIAQALENTQLAQMKQAIAAKQKDGCVKLYEQTMEGCYACHKASDKPYLRPQRPANPEAPIINFDPAATTPP
jgi:hypothetical protein